MEMRRVIILSLIVIFALSSYLILVDKYNPMGVELSFRGNVTNEDSNKIKKISQINSTTINYSMPYKKHTLIMTTGMDRQFKNIKIIQGQFISDLDKKVATIGDKVANSYFRTENVVGKEIELLGERYEIIGILEKSDRIYIPFTETLTTLDWKTKTVKYAVKDKEPIYTVIKKVEGQLKNLGRIEVYDTIVYMERIYGYVNLIIMVVIYILVFYIYKLYKSLKKEILLLFYEYSKQKRTIEWYMFIKHKLKYVVKSISKLIAIVILLFSILKSKSYLFIVETIIPENLFSPSSYIGVIKIRYEQLILHLHNGFNDILIHTTFINIIALFIIFLITLILKKGTVKKEKYLSKLEENVEPKGQ